MRLDPEQDVHLISLILYKRMFIYMYDMYSMTAVVTCQIGAVNS